MRDLRAYALTASFPTRHCSTTTITRESSEEYFEDDSDSMSSYPQRVHGNSSGMTSSGVRTTSTKRKRVADDADPIIFYNGARFCTDLSGHRQAQSNPNAPAYTRISATAVGDDSLLIAQCSSDEDLSTTPLAFQSP